MRRLVGGKQPAETFFVGFDFSPLLASGETLTEVGSTVSAVVAGTATDATATIIATGSMAVADGAASNSVLQARLSGGTDGERYKVSFRAATSAGNLYEQDLLVHVRG